MKHLERYKDRYPDRTESFTLIGDLKGVMGKYEESEQYYEKALLLAPQDVKIQLKIAKSKLNLGSLETALNQYTRLLGTYESDKQKARIYQGLIGYYQMTGQMNKALEYAKLRLDTMEKYTPPVLILEVQLLSIENYVQAGKEEEAWQLVADLKKNMPPSLMEKMVVGDMIILLEIGTADEIEKLMPAFESLGKKLGEATHNLLLNMARAKIAELRQQYSQARQYYRQQLKLRPKSTSTKRQIAICFMKEKKYKEAETLLKEVHTIYPFDPQFNLDLAELYWQMDKKKSAIDHLKRAMAVWQKADPQYEPAQRARKRMAEWQL